MRYVFRFDFSLPPAPSHSNLDESDDIENSQVALVFVLDEIRMQNLGFVTPDVHNDNYEPYLDWFSQTCEDLEGQFSAVHDVSGTQDDHVFVEGFGTYEIPNLDQAHALMTAWRDAFVNYLGREEGVSPIVALPESLSHVSPTELVEWVDQALIKRSPGLT